MNEPKGVFFFFSMLDNFNMLMEQNEPAAAYEYINAIRNYAIEGKFYEGSNLIVQLLMNGDMKVMDSVQEKRQMGLNGGKANLDLKLDDRILQAIEGYTFKSKAALVKFVDGKRTTVLDHVKKLGFFDEDWLVSSQEEEIMERSNSNFDQNNQISQKVTQNADGMTNFVNKLTNGQLTSDGQTSLTIPLTNGQLTESDKDNRQSKDANGSYDDQDDFLGWGNDNPSTTDRYKSKLL